jgi:radical SAM protein with 4Fe4S-binding SPASM domain
MLTSPLTIHFEVTDSCNNSCPHCYGSSWLEQKQRPRPPIVDVARHITDNNLFDVVITGGEPLLLGVDVLCDIFEIFNTNNIKYSLNTNGRLLSSDACTALMRGGLKGVLVSLHSWDNSLHDTMVNAPNAASETKAGIQNAIAHGLKVTVNQVIGTQNIDTMFATSTALAQMGVHALSYSRLLSPLDVNYKITMVDASRFLDEYIRCREALSIPVTTIIPVPYCADPRVKDLHEQLNCTGGVSSAAISCYGDVRFCPQDTHTWGNVFQEDLPAIWGRIVEWRAGIAVPEDCKDCAFVADCRGACRLASKICLNDYSAKDPWAKDAQRQYIRKVHYNEFNLDRPYLLLPDIRWRREGDAFLLYSQNHSLLVNSDGVKFVQGLARRFVPNQLDLGVETNRESLLGFLELLYQNGFVVGIS